MSTQKSKVSKTVKDENDVVEQKKYRVRVDLDPNTMVTVRNGFQGRLVYVNPRTKEEWFWDEFGDEQDLTLAELRIARNSYKSLFENNWFMIDDPEVIDYLNAGAFYKNAISIDEFDSVFTMTPAKIKEVLSKVSNGQKKSIAYRAKQLIANDEIDSIKAINALEEALGILLIER